MTVDVRAYPLAWPIGRPRTSPSRRLRSKFKHSGKPWTFNQTRSDLPLRKDGEAYASRRANDPGVAVYFRRSVRAVDGGAASPSGGERWRSETRPYVMAADLYDRLPDNMRALVVVIEALRKIERHGSPALMEQAFAGFTALPPASPTGDEQPKQWWATLGVSPAEWRGQPASIVLEHVKSQYRRRIKELSNAFYAGNCYSQSEKMRVMNEARSAAIMELMPLGEGVW